jgi:hypothetical protein
MGQEHGSYRAATWSSVTRGGGRKTAAKCSPPRLHPDLPRFNLDGHQMDREAASTIKSLIIIAATSPLP